MSNIDLKKNWEDIRQHFSASFKTNLHVSIASNIPEEGLTVTPIGSFFLNKDLTGFYFEKYPTKLAEAAIEVPSICILGVNSSRWFWLKSLFRGRFSKSPAIKLYGTLGNKRKASSSEMKALKKRMRWTSPLKGHQYLWANMQYIREVKIIRGETINLGKMSDQHEG